MASLHVKALRVWDFFHFSVIFLPREGAVSRCCYLNHSKEKIPRQSDAAADKGF